MPAARDAPVSYKAVSAVGISHGALYIEATAQALLLRKAVGPVAGILCLFAKALMFVFWPYQEMI